MTVGVLKQNVLTTARILPLNPLQLARWNIVQLDCTHHEPSLIQTSYSLCHSPSSSCPRSKTFSVPWLMQLSLNGRASTLAQSQPDSYSDGLWSHLSAKPFAHFVKAFQESSRYWINSCKRNKQKVGGCVILNLCSLFGPWHGEVCLPILSLDSVARICS